MIPSPVVPSTSIPSSPLAPYVTLVEGRDISDSGFIVADGIDVRTGETHAYLLTPPPQSISDCGHTSGIAPLFDAVFDRQAGPPDTYQASFQAPVPESGFLCIEDGVNGKPSITSGSINLNGPQVVGPSDFERAANDGARSGGKGGQGGSNNAPGSLIEVSVSLLVENSLTVRLASKPGAEIRVRVFAAAPTAPTAAGAPAAVPSDPAAPAAAPPSTPAPDAPPAKPMKPAHLTPHHGGMQRFVQAMQRFLP